MLKAPISQTQELALIAASLKGAGDAFETLLKPYLPEVKRILSQRLSLRGGDAAGEALQEVMVTAWRALERFDSNYRFKNYLFGIVREVIRRALSHRPREIPTSWEQEESSVSGDPPPSSYEDSPGRIRTLIGVERYRMPDEARIRQKIFGEMLEAMLAYGGYPHQQIAFAHSIVLWGKAKDAQRARQRSRATGATGRTKVPVTGDPDRVVHELSEQALGLSLEAFRREIASRQAADPQTLDRAFEPVDYRLSLLGRDLFAADGRSARLFGDLSEDVISQTLLRQYYGKDARKSIADWTERVKRRTREALLGGIDPRRSPLPWSDGHENGAPAG